MDRPQAEPGEGDDAGTRKIASKDNDRCRAPPVVRASGASFQGFKFKRQMPIGRYIVGFVCFERKLIIEVDGGQHADNASDAQRDAWLEGQGFHIQRFWNNDVLNNTKGVLETIVGALDRRAPNPSPGSTRVEPPSPTRGEGRKET